MQRQKHFFILFFVAFFCFIGSSNNVSAQEDTEFWFAMPRMLSWHNNVKGAAYELIIFNHNSVDAHVKISQPTNTMDGAGKLDKSATVKAGEYQIVTLASSKQVFHYADSISVPYDVVTQRGIYVESDVSVQCYFRVTKGNGEAFTLKGHNALGTEFIVAMQNRFENGRGTSKKFDFNGSEIEKNMYDDSYAGVAIVATENKTIVTITPTKSISKGCNTSPITVTLNRGETYAFRACSEKGSDHPIGTKIDSNKPIAVTYNDDCLMSGKSSDAVGEQLTSTILAGKEYVAVSNKTSNDYVFLIGLSDGTKVTGSNGKTYNLNKGSVEQISLESAAAIYLEGDAPFEVFQVTSYKGKNGNEMGGTVLPQISCTGSKSASYIRINEGAILNLVTRKENIDALKVNGKAISSSDFKQVGSSDYYAFSGDLKEKFGITDKQIDVTSSKGIFQMGVLDYKGGETATLGFFSSYVSSATVTINEENTNRYNVCKGSPLKIKVTPVDNTIVLADADVEWRDLTKGGAVIEELKSDVLDIAKVDFDTAAYQVVWKNACGISSFVNIMISVKEPVLEEHTATGCGSYKWDKDGKTYTESGDYEYITTTEFGCEEKHILHLTIIKPKEVHDYVEASKNYTWPRTGKLITGSSAYTEEIDDESGCVKTKYYLHLKYIGTITAESYTWRGHTYTESTTETESETLSDGTENNYTLILDLIKPEARPFSTGKCGITVTFAQGNLQYQASTGTWRFADNQWDYIGEGNKNISPSYDGWIDLFGWGTGDNPTNTSTDDASYVGVTNIAETEFDWGSNTIVNGGSTEWHSLTYEEWKYILTDRKDAAKKYGCATVNGVKGVVLLPDDWILPSSASFTPSYRNYSSNVYTASQWAIMQAAGAVFLPAAGTRYPSGTINKTNNTGYYWTATAIGTTKAWDFYFDKDTIKYFQGQRSYGDAVRLVKYINQTPHVGIGEETKKTCEGKYTWYGKTYTESGDYQTTLTGPNGCDSIVTLHLTVGQEYEVDTFATECDKFTWHLTNTTYTKGGNYIYMGKTKDDCDSIVTLHLTINKSEAQELTVTSCDSYYWAEADKEYTESGDYTITTTTDKGCTRTVTLHLTINDSKEVYLDPVDACESYYWDVTKQTYTESGIYYADYKTKSGCDSTIYLDLTIHHGVVRDTVAEACDEFTWHGKTYTESTNTMIKGKTVHGCDSIVNLHLTIHKSYHIDTTAVKCDEFTWYGNTYKESGDYTYPKKTVAGCDSIVTLHLTINDSKEVHLPPVDACESYYWDVTDKTYTESGTYQADFKTKAGCDSIVYLDLAIHHGVVRDTVAEACDEFTWHGKTYTSSTNTMISGHTIHGCDSTVNLHLTIHKSYHIDTTAVKCDEFTWYGQTYTKSGDYTYSKQTVAGCDSIVTLHLTINNSTTGDTTAVECEQFTWYGKTYKESGDYDHLLKNKNGCDSTLTLHLKIVKPDTTHHYETICPGTTFEWGGIERSAKGDYPLTTTSLVAPYCDSVSILHLSFYDDYRNMTDEPLVGCDSVIWNGEKYFSSGNYTQKFTSINGCDSIVTRTIKVNKSKHTPLVATICYNTSYTLGSKTITQSGTFADTLKTVNGCDSILDLALTVLPEKKKEVDVTVCPGNGISVTDKYGDKHVISSPGRYEFTLLANDGCDSTLIINFAYYSNDPVHVYDTICDGETYHRNGYSYTTGGDYSVTLLTEDGCDYKEILHLKVNPTYNNISQFDTICGGGQFEWEGSVYTTQMSDDKTITDTKTLTSLHGCDSTVTLYLRVYPSFNLTDYMTLCQGEQFKWGDFNIASVVPADSRDYNYTFKTVHGCDSIVTMKLTVNPTFNVSFNDTVCDNEAYHWQGDAYSYSSSRDISDTKTLKSIHGCDSLVTMKLHFNPTKTHTFAAEICDNEVYEWNGKTYNTAGAHQQHLYTTAGCDSIVTLQLTVHETFTTQWADTIIEGKSLTWQGSTYTETGAYTKQLQSKHGCDSIVTLNLMVNSFIINDIIYDDFCVATDSAGEFTLQVARGYIHRAKLTFDSKAHAQGIRDTVINIDGANHALSVRIPMRARAGKYGMTAEYFFRNELIMTQQITFNVLYPTTVLLQKWNDFIGVQTFKYNGGYEFVAFEWYKNGELMAGEHGSYIYQPLEMGSIYTALLTDTTGLQMMTCPLIAVDKDDIGLYPTVAHPRQNVRLHSTQDAIVNIYDATGKQVMHQQFSSGDSDFASPDQVGVYIVKIQLADGENERTYKLIVK